MLQISVFNTSSPLSIILKRFIFGDVFPVHFLLPFPLLSNSVSFLVTCFLILFMCVEILKNPETFLDQLYNWEMIGWGLLLGFLMLRLITLGSKINKKYRNLSVLLTEQINLYLQVRDGRVVARIYVRECCWNRFKVSVVIAVLHFTFLGICLAICHETNNNLYP